MDFELSEEQKSIKALVREFCQRELDVADFQRRADIANQTVSTVEELRSNMPWDLLEKLHDVGLRQLAVPERYGGGEAGFLTLCLVSEEAGHQGGVFADFLNRCYTMTGLLREGASEEQQDEFLPQFMEDKHYYISISLTEPDVGGDIHLPYMVEGTGLKTSAYREGNEWILNGEKNFCSAGGVSKLVIMCARTRKGGMPTENTSLFLVPTNTPGLSVAKVNHLIAGHITGNVAWLLENVRVPHRYLLGEENKGLNLAAGGLMKYIWFAGHIGWLERTFDQTLEYAKTRIQGGRPIIEHPNVAALISEMRIKVETLRLLLYRGAWEYERDFKEKKGPTPLWFFWLNYLYKEVALRMCQVSAEIFAGVGATKDLPIEAFWRFTFGTYHGGATPILNLLRSTNLLATGVQPAF